MRTILYTFAFIVSTLSAQASREGYYPKITITAGERAYHPKDTHHPYANKIKPRQNIAFRVVSGAWNVTTGSISFIYNNKGMIATLAIAIPTYCFLRKMYLSVVQKVNAVNKCLASAGEAKERVKNRITGVADEVKQSAASISNFLTQPMRNAMEHVRDAMEYKIGRKPQIKQIKTGLKPLSIPYPGIAVRKKLEFPMNNASSLALYVRSTPKLEFSSEKIKGRFSIFSDFVDSFTLKMTYPKKTLQCAAGELLRRNGKFRGNGRYIVPQSLLNFRKPPKLLKGTGDVEDEKKDRNIPRLLLGIEGVLPIVSSGTSNLPKNPYELLIRADDEEDEKKDHNLDRFLSDAEENIELKKGIVEDVQDAYILFRTALNWYSTLFTMEPLHI